MNFGNTIIIRHFGPENHQNPTQKDTNFRNTIIIHHFGPENPQNPTKKDTNFKKMHSLTPAKIPTNKKSIRFSRISHFLHHDSNALINPIQHQPTNHFWEHLVTHFLNLQTNCDICRASARPPASWSIMPHLPSRGTKRLEWVSSVGVRLSNSTLKIGHDPILVRKASANQRLYCH